ncbi:glycosyltransferase family 2 protein [Paenibacillus sp. GCM10023248]|uniref:glycosyltransferase family 2 protein n=1 Tax=Bacillales TaxID=1385 RepID=UPI0023794099|nr:MULTISPECIES: glycosyltransferase family 2 protein [Bacillales]MDD9267332.1 glycosyltransferase family 2 protein [Paenibacillus sp. MAHUQ-63]MDR6884832.1 glycosyltransferase involved in cell wall biosynthesis [Bacillus sp. 3255]
MNPLVSILIPTYNRPDYFEQALKSALAQTYPNIEVVVSDNSETNATELVVQKYQAMPGGSRIRYVRNAQNIGPIANQQQALNMAYGEFVNYLMDDDLFHPQKIEKMMAYMLQYPDVTLVTSQRRVVNSKGNQLYVPPIGTFKLLYPKDTVVDGRILTKRLLEDKTNYLGEPTTVLFRRKDLVEPFGMLLGRQVYFAVDLASWLNLLDRGRGVYMVQPLSYLRYHSQQLSQHEMAKTVAKMDVETFKNFAVQKGYATPQMIKDFEKQQEKKNEQPKQQKSNQKTIQLIDQKLLQDTVQKTFIKLVSNVKPSVIPIPYVKQNGKKKKKKKG